MNFKARLLRLEKRVGMQSRQPIPIYNMMTKQREALDTAMRCRGIEPVRVPQELSSIERLKYIMRHSGKSH